MAPTEKTGFVNWTFGGWRRESTAQKRRDKLVRHIEEVERFAFECEDNRQKMKLQETMLPRLEEQLEKLDVQLQIGRSSALTSRLGKTSKFVRGDGA